MDEATHAVTWRIIILILILIFLYLMWNVIVKKAVCGTLQGGSIFC